MQASLKAIQAIPTATRLEAASHLNTSNSGGSGCACLIASGTCSTGSSVLASLRAWYQCQSPTAGPARAAPTPTTVVRPGTPRRNLAVREIVSDRPRSRCHAASPRPPPWSARFRSPVARASCLRRAASSASPAAAAPPIGKRPRPDLASRFSSAERPRRKEAAPRSDMFRRHVDALCVGGAGRNDVFLGYGFFGKAPSASRSAAHWRRPRETRRPRHSFSRRMSRRPMLRLPISRRGASDKRFPCG